jgi:translocation protein SEC66
MSAESDSFTSSITSEYSGSATSSFSSTATATATAGAGEGNEFIPPVSISIKTPLLYLGILIITLVLFSIYHRRSKINKLQKLTSSSLFNPAYEINESNIIETIETFTPTPDSTQAIIYHDLKELNAHEKMLKTSLVIRAAESMRRIIKLKETEASIMILYTRGLIGDDSYKRFKMQSKLQDAEMMEIAKEAESIKQGWSRTIYMNAQEVMMNQALRRRVNAINDRIIKSSNLEVKNVEYLIDDIQKRVGALKKV